MTGPARGIAHGAAGVVSVADLPGHLAVGDLSDADVVVTGHHRPELGEVLRDVLARRVRWVGVLGNPAEIAPSTLAGLLADRNGRSGAPHGG